MESRVENVSRITMNAKPAMFHAGLSAKFTKRHMSNFQDTTIMAASAAKVRAELKIERQASAIEKQQQKIEQEMQKIKAITEKLQRQQAREARRLRDRLEYAAARIQTAYRSHLRREDIARTAASIEIQRHWRGSQGRRRAWAIRTEYERQLEDYAARAVTRSIRIFASRVAMRRELQWREFAATAIQSAVRRYQAIREYAILRRDRAEHARRYRAATAIQAHARGFLTRLVFMDVLYLVCRIQSVARGFLVRKRLRWLLSLDLDGIVKIQALIRRFLTRQQTKHLQALSGGAHTRERAEQRYWEKSMQPRLLLVREEKPAAVACRPPNASNRKKLTAVASQPSWFSPLVTSPPRVKRSYWLPSGANTFSLDKRRRLPHLTDRQPLVRMLSSDSASPTRISEIGSEFSDAVRHAAHIQRVVRGHLREHRPPRRLAPLGRLIGEEANDQGEGEEALRRTAEERHKREEELKRKLQARRADQKQRQELDALRREQEEQEEKERRLMEREEKLVRLWVKTTHRKHLELRQRRQSIDQLREERERMEMLREERLVRLHSRKLLRLAKQAFQMKRASNLDLPSDGDDSDDGTPVAKETRDEDERTFHRRDNRLGLDRGRRASQLPAPPSNHRRTKPLSKPTGISLNKTRQLREVYGPKTVTNQRLEERNREYDLRVQYAEWNFHTDDFSTQPDIVQDEVEFDYGHEFDDIVEETKLIRLLR